MSALLQYFPFLECVCIQDDDEKKSIIAETKGLDNTVDQSDRDESVDRVGRSTRDSSKHGKKGSRRKAKDKFLMTTKPRGSLDESIAPAVDVESESRKAKSKTCLYRLASFMLNFMLFRLFHRAFASVEVARRFHHSPRGGGRCAQDEAH
jgi:hypothetical protein